MPSLELISSLGTNDYNVTLQELGTKIMSRVYSWGSSMKPTTSSTLVPEGIVDNSSDLLKNLFQTY